MRILMTGPGGFLGSSLAKYWAAKGHELILLARPNACLDRLGELGSTARIIRSNDTQEIINTVLDVKPEVIVHTACAYGRKGESSLDVMDANLRLGAVLLQALLNELSRELPAVSFLNTGTVLAPDVNLYALSKHQFSAWGMALSMQKPQRLRFIDIRLQQMYGPGDDSSKFTMRVIEACCSNEPRLELTAGDQQRDFIYIDDVVRAYDCILKRHDEFRNSDTIEVGSGIAVTMRHFAEQTKQIAGASTILDFGAVPYRTNEAMLCVADTTRLSSLGWRQEVSLAVGLMQMIDAVGRSIKCST